MLTFGEPSPEQLSIDHTVEVNSLTGTARVSVPLRISPGRENFTPRLSLDYSSGGGNSTFGRGWFLGGVPSIGLDTRRELPRYNKVDARYLFSGGQALVPARQGGQPIVAVRALGGAQYTVQRYRTRLERSFERFERWEQQQTGRVHWLAYARNGVVSRFGFAADNSSRIADPADPDQRTFQWLLEVQVDSKGNGIIYDYAKEDKIGVDLSRIYETNRGPNGPAHNAAQAQRYLKRVRYANSHPLSLTDPPDAQNIWHMELVFDYGEHGDPANPAAPPTYAAQQPWPVRLDPFSSFRPGFELRTYRRCARILMFHRFPALGNAPRLIGATTCQYQDDPAGSSLQSIVYHGYRSDLNDGSIQRQALPPLRFAYSGSPPDTSFAPADAEANVPGGVDGNRFQWIDLRNEGLPGILWSHEGAWYFKENRGGGTFGPIEAVDRVPAAVSAAFHLQDFDGDGNLNLVGFEGREAGYYARDRGDGAWQGYRPFENLPRVDFVNARVQWLDLNGDGYSDLLVDHQDQVAWYPSAGATGFDPAIHLSRPHTNGPPTLMQNGHLGTFFADMSGDGLPDMVQIENGSVEYWPNLGYGHFGPSIQMEDAPFLERGDLLDMARLRFVDLDGSGTADLVYLGDGEVRYWINQQGNRFGPLQRITNLPHIDNLTTIQIVDFLGDGTRCLVWSSPLPSHDGAALQYLRLTPDLPPGLMVEIDNSLGRISQLHYRSSAQDYLRDKESDHPWPTPIPSHPMVVAQQTGIDQIGGGRLHTRYTYHDGTYDDDERRFVGFGVVDTFDTDDIVDTFDMNDVLPVQPQAAAFPEEVTPPTLTRTFYHTGAPSDWISRAARFYNGDAQQRRLPVPHLSAGMRTVEQIEALRTLAGTVWRQESYVYQPDGQRAPHPLRTSEYGYAIDLIQPQVRERDAVFTFVQREALHVEYEQNPADPRILHQFVLATDAYGNITQRASVAYPRRPGAADLRGMQQELHADLAITRYLSVDTPNRYEVGIDVEMTSLELAGLAPVDTLFTWVEFHTQVQQALNLSTVEFHQPLPAGAPAARRLALRQNHYWNDGRTAALPVGQVGAVTLIHHVERACLPTAAITGNAIDPYGGRIDPAQLAAEGHYANHDGYWWAVDTRYHYRDRAAFYRLVQEVRADGGTSTYAFDAHWLLVTEYVDSVGNHTRNVYDYQVLNPATVQDTNDTVHQTRYDPLGLPMLSSSRGQQIGTDGAAHPIGSGDLAAYQPRANPTLAAILADPAHFLQDAAQFIFYDLDAPARGDGPPVTLMLLRETYVDDGEGGGDANGPIHVSLRYWDGFGRAIQSKQRIDPGPAIQRDVAGALVVDGEGVPILAPSAQRWQVEGHVVYSNKGLRVREYEPYFSPTPAFESDAALRAYGVATRIHHDPAGRIIRTEHPNGTETHFSYGAWSRAEADPNDTVAGSAYAAARQALPANDPERQALDASLAHADTPIIVEFDPLGRAVRQREVGTDNAGIGNVERVTHSHLNAQGLPTSVVDPRGIVAQRYHYDMLGRIIQHQSADGGPQWVLLDGFSRTVHRWDARDIQTRYGYDTNDRPKTVTVTHPGEQPRLVRRWTYGDEANNGLSAAQAAARNLRGRILRQFDEAGTVEFSRYSSDGDLLEQRRQLRQEYRATVDWQAANIALEADVYTTATRYDAFGRMVQQTAADGTTRDFAYNAAGQLASLHLTTADGDLVQQPIAAAIEHNARGQRTHVELGNGVATDYTFDPHTFRLTRLHSHRIGGAVAVGRSYQEIAYTYDATGNVIRLVDAIQEPGTALPVIQGLQVSAAQHYTYDAFNQLIAATGRVHQALVEHDYRDGLPAANAIKSTRHISLNNGAAIERYTRTYDYDLSGNRTRIRHQGATQNWTTDSWIAPDANRRLPANDLNGNALVNPASFFDANGNTIRQSHLQELAWDHENRLVAVTLIDRSGQAGPNPPPNPQPDDMEYYVYGAHGGRIRRVTERLVGGQIETTDTRYLDGCEIRRVTRDGVVRLARRTSHLSDGSRRLATLHQWDVDLIGVETDNIAQKRLHYLLDNHLGSVALELDQAGSLVSYEEYFPFGGTSFIAGPSIRDIGLKEVRFSGKVRDDATGFYCFEYRYYAPWIGNWLSPDPLGPLDGLNLYCYVHNNPVRFVDAYGLQSSDAMTNYGSVAADATEAEAIAQFNATHALEVGFFVTDLQREGTDRIIVSTRAIDPDVLEAARQTDSVEFAELITDLREISIGLDPDSDEESDSTSDGDKDSDTDGTGKDGSGGKSDKSKGPGAGKTGTGQGAQTSEGEKGVTESTGSGTGTVDLGGTGKSTKATPGDKKGPAADQDGSKDQPAGKTGKGTLKGKATSGNAKNGATDIPTPPPNIPTGEGGIPWTPDLDLPEVLPEGGTPVTDPSQIRSGQGQGDDRSTPGSDAGSGTRPDGLAGGKPNGTGGGKGNTQGQGQGGAKDGAKDGKPGEGKRGLKGGRGTHELPSWLSWIDTGLDWLQTGLDVIGLIPGLGEIADGINGLISLMRGDYVAAGLSFAAMIPFAGWAATAGKFGKKAVNAVDTVADVTSAVSKHGDEAASVITTVTKNSDEALAAIPKPTDIIDNNVLSPLVTATHHAGNVTPEIQSVLTFAQRNSGNMVVPTSVVRESLRHHSARQVLDTMRQHGITRIPDAAPGDIATMMNRIQAARPGRVPTNVDTGLITLAEQQGLRLTMGDRRAILDSVAVGYKNVRARLFNPAIPLNPNRINWYNRMRQSLQRAGVPDPHTITGGR